MMKSNTALPALILVALSALVLAGCSALPLNDVDAERLTVNVEYRQMPDQIEVVTDLRAGGFRNRRVAAGSGELVLEDASGRRTALEPTRRRGGGEYRLQANVGNGPYTLIVGGVHELALPMGPTVVLEDPEQRDGQSVTLDDRLQFRFDNHTDDALRWSYTGQCGSDSWQITRQLEREDAEFSVSTRMIKQQLDRASGANLLGTIPVTVTLYRTYQLDAQPPFRVREARAQDSVSVALRTSSVGVSVSASVGMQISPGAFLSVGAQTRPSRRC